LVGEAFDVVKAGPADDADVMFGHGEFLTANRWKDTKIKILPR
jgi:endo-1,4-beta-D-glucanase Y